MIPESSLLLIGLRLGNGSALPGYTFPALPIIANMDRGAVRCLLYITRMLFLFIFSRLYFPVYSPFWRVCNTTPDVFCWQKIFG